MICKQMNFCILPMYHLLNIAIFECVYSTYFFPQNNNKLFPILIPIIRIFMQNQL